MITIKTADGKFFFSTFINLLEEEQAEVDETTLSLQELQYVVKSVDTGRILVEASDLDKVKTRIISLSSSGEIDPSVLAGKEDKTNKADIVGEGSDTLYPTTNAVKEYITEELSPVAFSGNYLDLINRPSGGNGEPFTVVPWNPYREDLVEIDFTAANSSTTYVRGHISKKASSSVIVNQIDVGYPNSPEIVVTNGVDGGLTNIQITPNGTDALTKTLAIKEVTSLAINPVDVFAHDTGQTKGAVLSFVLFQLESGEDVTTMSLQDIMGKPRNISVNFQNVYLNEYNTYTTMSYSIINNGNGVESSSGNVYGNYLNLSFKLENNRFKMGENYADSYLGQYGFEADKKFGCIFICQVSPSQFDVKTPFNISLSELALQPSITASAPDFGEIKANIDSKLLIAVESDPNSPNAEYFGLSLNSSGEDLNYFFPNNQMPIGPEFIDTDGNITFRVDGNSFQFKDVASGQFLSMYSRSYPVVSTTIIGVGFDTKSDWYFDLTSWKKRYILEGILPETVSDGSVLYITGSGKFANKELLPNDYIQLYQNRTNFILNRQVDVEPLINTKLNQLAGPGLSLTNDKLQLKLASSSGLELLNDELRVIDYFDNKYITYPVLYHRLYEQVIYSNQSRILPLDLTNSCNIYVYKLYPYGENYFSNINIATNAFGTTTAIGKTVTMLFKDFTENAYLTWPTEFKWADGNVPAVEIGKTLLVTGIVMGTQFESYTDSKLLCTYSIF